MNEGESRGGRGERISERALIAIICIMAQALERRFGATIAGLSPTEDGFYVDALLPDSAYIFFYIYLLLIFSHPLLPPFH